MRRLKFALLYRLEKFFWWLHEWSREMYQRVAYCANCGRNRYRGPPCVNYE